MNTRKVKQGSIVFFIFFGLGMFCAKFGILYTILVGMGIYTAFEHFNLGSKW